MRFGLLVLLAAGSLAAGEPVDPPDPGAAGLTPGQRRGLLVARSAWEHARLETLEAAFVQRKENVMLLEPEESTGTFAYRAPDLMRWDYVHPGADHGNASPNVTVIINGQSMVTWYHDLERAERVDVGRRGEKMLKLLGPGASLADLERYFTLAVELPEAAGEPYGVHLEPRSARVGRRLRSIDMELDPALFVPGFLRLTDPEGGTTELRFKAPRINGAVPAERFGLALPDDVGITPASRPPS